MGGGSLMFLCAVLSGVTIYAVGVGKAIEQELREIASEPDEKYLYYAEDFKDMGEITKKLKSRICTGVLLVHRIFKNILNWYFQLQPAAH